MWCSNYSKLTYLQWTPNPPLVSLRTKGAVAIGATLVGIIALLSVTGVTSTALEGLKLGGAIAFTCVGGVALIYVITTVVARILFNLILDRPLKVVIQSNIHQDGWGDYFSLLNGAKELKKVLPPGSEVIVLYSTLKAEPPVNLGEYNLTENEVFNIASLDLDLQNLKAQKITNFCRQADFMFTLPIVENIGWKTSRHVNRTTEYVAIGEYRAANQLKKEQYHVTMGLDKGCAGIFLPETDLGNFSKPELNTLFQNDPPYFCYSRNPQKFMNYVLRAHNEKEIRVICPLQKQKEWLDKIDLEGVSKIIGVKGGVTEVLLVNDSASDGKVVTLIDPFPLSHHDFLLCIRKSQPIVGCTGDISFSEVLSLGKVPFYEVAVHKEGFWRSFIEFAKRHGKTHIFEFARQLPNHPSGYCPPDKVTIPDVAALHREFLELRAVIRANHQVKFALDYYLKSRLFQKKHPRLARLI